MRFKIKLHLAIVIIAFIIGLISVSSVRVSEMQTNVLSSSSPEKMEETKNEKEEQSGNSLQAVIQLRR